MLKQLTTGVAIFLLATTTRAVPEAATPERTVLALQAGAARCQMVNIQIDVRLPRNPSAQRISKGLDASKACVDESLPKGKEIFRQGIAASPRLSPQLSRIYARWLDYMHSLESGYAAGTWQDAAEARFQEAISDMQADIDAHNP